MARFVVSGRKGVADIVSNLKSVSPRPVSRSLLFGTALASVAACALLSPPAKAAGECGLASNGTVTCTAAGNPYANGISYASPQDLTVVLADGVVVNSGTNPGVSLTGSGNGAVTLNSAANSIISTTGNGATGVLGMTDSGDLTVNAGSITTSGGNADGVRGYSQAGAVSISAGAVTTTGQGSIGILAIAENQDASVAVGDLSTTGYGARGVIAYSALGNATVTSTGTITTSGDNASGVEAISGYAQGDATINVNNVSVSGDHVRGLFGTTYGYPFGSAAYAFGANATINISGDLSASGEFTRGAYARALYHAEVNAAGTVSTTADYSNAITVVGFYGGATVNAGDVTTPGA
jgi:hypothetical protein